MSSVACTGAETRLVDCTSSTPRCSDAHDAGVRCMLRTGRLYLVSACNCMLVHRKCIR